MNASIPAAASSPTRRPTRCTNLDGARHPGPHRRRHRHRHRRRADRLAEDARFPRADHRRAVRRLFSGIALADVTASYENGVGGVLGYVGVLIALGAMLGKLLARLRRRGQGGRHPAARPPAALPWKMALIAGIIGIPMFFESRPGAADPGGHAGRAPDRGSRDAAGNPGAGRPVRAARLRPAAPRPARRDRAPARERRHHAGARPARRDPDGVVCRSAVRHARRAHGPDRRRRRRSRGRRTEARTGPPTAPAPDPEPGAAGRPRTGAASPRRGTPQDRTPSRSPSFGIDADHDAVAGRADADQGRREPVDGPRRTRLPVPAVHRRSGRRAADRGAAGHGHLRHRGRLLGLDADQEDRRSLLPIVGVC